MIIRPHLSLNSNNHNAILRCLEPSDVTATYVESLSSVGNYLGARSKNITRTDQIEYISRILDSDRDSILGFFVENSLVGTTGIQNLVGPETTSLGVFLFDIHYRGLGLGKSLVWGCCRLLNHSHRVTSFRAGIDPSNHVSLKTFIGCGFQITEQTEKKYRVHLHIGSLKRPDNIISFKTV